MNSAETGQNDTASVSQITYTNENRVSCNGGGGALGHPLVWLTLGGDGRVACPYCSRLFIMVRPKPEV